MKSIVNILLVATALILPDYACKAAELKRKSLTPTEQKSFLSKRTSGGMMGPFASYSSLLYALNDVVIHSKDDAINKTALSSPFPDFYKPTWEELFDTIARQTKSAWTYDPKRDFWIFAAPPKPLCFELTLAEGWQPHNEGLYIGYQPSIAPVGMDVYILGHYSSTNKDEEAALFIGVREAIAVRFAKPFQKDVSRKDMTEETIGNLRALHFKATGPTGIIWQQWVVVDSEMAFAIVSAIKPEHEKQILPDVLKMVASFKVLSSAGGTKQEVAPNGRDKE
jgi:hypothetical protein